jgi:hypothetical protein
MRQLLVAWRNPIPAHHVRRWQAVAKDSLRNVYAVQQLVKSGTHFEWSNTTCLELVHTREKAPAKQQKSSVAKWLLTSIP